MKVDYYNVEYPDDVPQAQRDAERERWIAALQESFPDADQVKVSFTSTWYGKRGVLKQVGGPPAWKFPRTKLDLHRSKTGIPVLHVGIGWRFTAYELLLFWTPRRKGDKT